MPKHLAVGLSFASEEIGKTTLPISSSEIRLVSHQLPATGEFRHGCKLQNSEVAGVSMKSLGDSLPVEHMYRA
jgi:hypothetical protein